MNVDSIRDGIVIDHIAAGNGMKLYRLLGLEGLDVPVAMITNVASKKRGRKLKDKKQIGMPEKLTNVLFCKNPRCITSCEQEIEHIFRLADSAKKEYRCVWCETKAAEL